jgi:cell division protein FtsB
MMRFGPELFRAARSASKGIHTGWVAGITLALAYVWMAFRGPQGIQSLIEKHHEISQLEEQNADKARQIETLRERIRRLEQSGSEQELEIRKELKLLRPGETTFLLPDPPKTSAGQSQ